MNHKEDYLNTGVMLHGDAPLSQKRFCSKCEKDKRHAAFSPGADHCKKCERGEPYKEGSYDPKENLKFWTRRTI